MERNTGRAGAVERDSGDRDAGNRDSGDRERGRRWESGAARDRGPRQERGSTGDRGSSGDRGFSGDRRSARQVGADRAHRAVARGGDPARQAAYQAIAAVNRDGAYANLVLPQILREFGVHGRDAAFATELTYGTLRAMGTLDAIVAAAAGREVDRIDPPARDALRLGAYQLLHTRVPAHAAVSTTVDLLRSADGPGATGFANAVLRQIGGRTRDEWLADLAPARDADPVGYLALTHSHPQWIVRAFEETLGGDQEETEALLVEDNYPAAVHLCARPGLVDAVELADEVGGAPGAFSPYAVYLDGGAPSELAAVREGRAHVQDEGSQLAALALADAEVVGEDTRWLDLCAGPGGKAALLGSLAALRGARLTAVEVAPHRAELVEKATRGLPVTVLCADGRDVGGPDLPEAGFDRVLVDAPCSGLGALRRRPEARWRRTPSDLPPLTRLQRELLTAAIRAVRPGGVVGYVTCSPHIVETQVTVTESARRSPHPVELLDARSGVAAGSVSMPGLGTGPTVQLWPHRHGTDAMFIALLRRTG
ncbi:transcription antitermination factor NusB [Rugosimonospora acidiphila]|uniref:Transcription antitermination factor NusB n=1 Tax=Rugosimonospora acidiphila TaxID=556531 RepID=A0ABP9SPL9_9ACTN